MKKIFLKDYSISTDGVVVNEKKKRILKPVLHNNGYYYIHVTIDGKRKNLSVHRLVAEAFIPNPDNLPCVNHINEDKTDNRVENLEWCTHKYNLSYGTCIERRARNKSLPVKQKTKDGKLIRVWDSIREAAQALGMKSQANISTVCKGKRKYAYGCTWEYVSLS